MLIVIVNTSVFFCKISIGLVPGEVSLSEIFFTYSTEFTIKDSLYMRYKKT